MRRRLYILMLLAVLLCGCYRDREIKPELLEVEEQLTSAPGVALATLQSWYPGKQFDKFNRSYYFLLLSQAWYDNGELSFRSDSIANVAMKRFSHSERTDFYARACLWKGRVMTSLNQPEQAYDIFLAGIHALEKKGGYPQVLSKLYDELGNTYLYEGLYADALEVYRQEYGLDSAMNDHRGLAFSLRNIGSAYHFMGMKDTTGVYTDSALYYYKEALRHARLSADSVYMSDVIYNDISIWYENNSEYARALLYADSIRQPDDKDKLNRASILIGLGQLDSALYLLDGLATSNNISMGAGYYGQLSRLEQKRGNYRAALEYYKMYDARADSIYGKRQTAELKAVEILHNVDRERTKIRNEYRTRVNILVSSIIALLIAGVTTAIIRRNRRKLAEAEREKYLLFKEKEADELMKEINRLKGELEKLLETSGGSDKEIAAKEKDIQTLSLELGLQRFRLKPIYESLVQIKQSKAGKLTPQQQEELEKEISLSFAEYIDELKKEYRSIKENDIVVLCLTEAGFSSPAIGTFLSLTESAIRKRTGRLKKKKAIKG